LAWIPGRSNPVNRALAADVKRQRSKLMQQPYQESVRSRRFDAVRQTFLENILPGPVLTPDLALSAPGYAMQLARESTDHGSLMHKKGKARALRKCPENF
jgi:hypothetical protein